MLKDSFKKFNKDWFIKNSGAVILIALATVACVYFLFSGASSERNRSDTSGINGEEYAEYLESKLESIISQISGVGKCKVMVMLKEQGTKVYAVEEKTSESSSSDGVSGHNQGDTLTEKSYVVLQSQSDEYPVQITQYLPQISGIVIVCSGGDSVSLKTEITELVCALTGLSSSNVHISRMGR